MERETSSPECDYFIGIRQLSQLLGITRPYALGLIKAGRFPSAMRLGDGTKPAWRVQLSDVQRLVAERQQAARDELNLRHVGAATASAILRDLEKPRRGAGKDQSR